MATWIFQGNPDRFDIDGYLRAELGSITWVVRQHKSRVAVGDTVFLWRAAGSDRDASGVVAESRVASIVAARGPESASLAFWKGEEPTVEDRVDLVVIRIASSRQVLKRDWLTADPILKGLLLFRQAQGTNYLLSNEEGRRLRMLWIRTGVEWTWRDSVAGLWAYEQTRGKEVSKLPGSPVAAVALATGRAVSGAYNKVMNFRALDPTDERKGFEGGGDVDRAVWERFFDPLEGRVDSGRLNAEVGRLGLALDEGRALDALPPTEPVEPVGTLVALVKRYEAARAGGAFPELPTVVQTTVQTFVRNPLVVSIAKLRAGCKCEIPGCSTPTFPTEGGEEYCEVHHVLPLAEGGTDVVENAICLCPVHHRQAHYGKHKDALRAAMRQIRSSMVV